MKKFIVTVLISTTLGVYAQQLVKPQFTPYSAETSSFYGGISKNLNTDSRSGPAVDGEYPEDDGSSGSESVSIPSVNLVSGRISPSNIEISWSLSKNTDYLGITGFSIQTRLDSGAWTQRKFVSTASSIPFNGIHQTVISYNPQKHLTLRVLPKLTSSRTIEIFRKRGIDTKYGRCSGQYSQDPSFSETYGVGIEYIYPVKYSVGASALENSHPGPKPNENGEYLFFKSKKLKTEESSFSSDITHSRTLLDDGSFLLYLREFSRKEDKEVKNVVSYVWNEQVCKYTEETVEHCQKYSTSDSFLEKWIAANSLVSEFSIPENPITSEDCAPDPIPEFSVTVPEGLEVKESEPIITETSKIKSSKGSTSERNGDTEAKKRYDFKSTETYSDEWTEESTMEFLEHLIPKAIESHEPTEWLIGSKPAYNLLSVGRLKGYSTRRDVNLRIKANEPIGYSAPLLPRDFIISKVTNKLKPDPENPKISKAEVISSSGDYTRVRSNFSQTTTESLVAEPNTIVSYDIGFVDLKIKDRRGLIGAEIESNTSNPVDKFLPKELESQDKIGPTAFIGDGPLNDVSLFFVADVQTPNAEKKAILTWTNSSNVKVIGKKYLKDSGKVLPDYELPKGVDLLSEAYSINFAQGVRVELTEGASSSRTCRFKLNVYDGNNSFVGKDSVVLNIVKRGSGNGQPPEDPNQDPNSEEFNLTTNQYFAGHSNRMIGLNGVPSTGGNIYVDAFNLQLQHNVTDFSIPVPGSLLKLNVNRVLTGEVFQFNNGLRPGERLDRPFGAAWSSNVSPIVKFTRANLSDEAVYKSLPNAAVTDETGAIYLFNKVNGKYIPTQSGPKSVNYLRTKFYNQGAIWFLEKADGTICKYEFIGNEQSLNLDRYTNKGGTIDMTYARMLEVKDRYGYSLKYSYNGTSLTPWKIAAYDASDVAMENLALHIRSDGNQVVSIWDPMGNQVDYGYEPKSITHNKNTDDLTFSGTTSYSLLNSITYPDTQPTSYSYSLSVEKDTLPRANPIHESDFYHLNLNSISQQDGTNLHNIQFRYRSNDLIETYSGKSVIKKHRNPGAKFRVSSIEQPNGGVARFDVASIDNSSQNNAVDLRGLLFPVSGFASTGSATGLSSTVNTSDRDIWVTDASGKVSRYVFKAATASSLSAFEAGYQSSNQSSFNLPSAIVYGKLEVVNALKGSETFSYQANAGMALQKYSDLNGYETNYEYGDSWTVPTDILSAYPGLSLRYAQPTKITNSLGEETVFQYQGGFRSMVSQRNAANQRTTFEVDEIGRVLSIRKYENLEPSSLLFHSSMEYSDTLPGFVTKTKIHALGLHSFDATAEPGEKEVVKTFVPDSIGRVAEMSEYPEGELNPPKLTTYYGYDWNNIKRWTETPTGSKTGDALALKVAVVDGRNRPTEIIYPDGHTEQSTYDGFGRLTTYVDRAGSTTHYEYSKLNKRTAVKRDIGTRQIVTQSTYDVLGNLLTMTDPEGLTTTYKYDDLHRLVSSENSVQGVTKYINGDQGTRTVLGLDYKPTTIIDPRGFKTEVVFDALYRNLESRRFYSNYPDGFIATLNSYNAVGQLQSVSRPDGTKYNYTYDGLGQLILFEHESKSGNLTRSNQNFYASTGKILKSIDFTGNETLFKYNGMRQLVKEVGPDQSGNRLTVSHKYDRAGNRVESLDSLNRKFEYEHDVIKRLTKRISPALENGQKPEASYEYNPVGKVVKEIDALARETVFAYDEAYRLTRITHPQIEGVSSFREMDYDDNGRLVTMTDEAGREHTYSYDGLGRLLQESHPLTATSEAVTRYAYDATGNRISLLDPKGQRYSYTYDGLGRQLETTDPSGAIVRNHYNGFNLNYSSGLGAKFTSYEYDDYNRLAGDYINQAAGERIGRQYAYDDADRLLSITPSDQNTEKGVTYQYDALGRVLQEQSQGVANTYTYDLLGNVTSMSYAANGVTVNYDYDDLNRLIQLTEGVQTVDYEYDLFGNVTKTSYGSSSTPHTEISSIYDARNRRTQLSAVSGSGSALYQHDFSYDVLGNVTKVQEYNTGNLTDRTVDLGYDFANRVISESVTIGTAVDHTKSYGYDGLNNILSRNTTQGATGVNRVYQYDALNQLLSYQEPSASAVEFTYDASGNRVSQLKDGVVTNYAYDIRNRLSSVTVGGERRTVELYQDKDSQNQIGQAEYYVSDPSSAQRTNYQYDILSRRISETSSSATTKYQYSGKGVIQEFSDSITSAQRNVSYVRGVGMQGVVGGLLYSNSSNGNLTWNHYNHRGDVIAQANATGSLTYRASYEAYGSVVAFDGVKAGRHGPNTKELDPTGLIYEGYRYRDPNTTAFLTRDPAGFIDGPNRYGYVRGNPWSYYDPYGLNSESVRLFPTFSYVVYRLFDGYGGGSPPPDSDPFREYTGPSSFTTFFDNLPFGLDQQIITSLPFGPLSVGLDLFNNETISKHGGYILEGLSWELTLDTFSEVYIGAGEAAWEAGKGLYEVAEFASGFNPIIAFQDVVSGRETSYEQLYNGGGALVNFGYNYSTSGDFRTEFNYNAVESFVDYGNQVISDPRSGGKFATNLFLTASGGSYGGAKFFNFSSKSSKFRNLFGGGRKAPNTAEGAFDFIPQSGGSLATRSQRRSFARAVKAQGFKVKYTNTGGSKFQGGVVTLNRKTATAWTLLDEYSHVFNAARGKGRYLNSAQAAQHQQLFRMVKQRGSTSALGDDLNTIYHQLELKNFLNSGASRPGFFKGIPESDISDFMNISVGGGRIGL